MGLCMVLFEVFINDGDFEDLLAEFDDVLCFEYHKIECKWSQTDIGTFVKFFQRHGQIWWRGDEIEGRLFRGVVVLYDLR